jgi:23S rRNA pseudouridine2605 synthase
VQKILSRAGLASRREAEEWIRAGRVTVNGEVAQLGSRASGHDQVKLDGRLVHQAPARRTATWLCHRSPGENLLPPREDSEQGDAVAAKSGRGAVSERLSRRVGRRYIPISAMPRIDGGLELLTSDGELAERLQRAVRSLPIEFSVRVRGELSPEQIDGVLEGQLDSGERLTVQECEPTGGEGANRWYRVLTVGASGRDLRALVERQAATVSRVLRVELGGLKLERTLSRGQVRQLTETEIQMLLAAATGSPATGP